MKCSCNMSPVDTDDYFKIVSIDMVSSFISKRCSECKRTIDSGEKFELMRGVHPDDIDEDGNYNDIDISSYHTCLDCLSLIKEFFNGYYSITGLWYDFYDNLDNMDGTVSEECISKLTPLAREKVCNAIEEFWTHYDEDDEE